MKKSNLINQPVVIWPKTFSEYKGMVGEVIGVFRPRVYDVAVQTEQTNHITSEVILTYMESELYFPRLNTYNQSCFN